jgi:hypothetical protein
MNFFRSVFFIVYVVLVCGCADGPYQEQRAADEPEGPGLFTGEKEAFSFSDYFSEEKKAEKTKKSRSDSADINLPAIDESSFEDFESFKAWRRAQDPSSQDYQEYQDWRAYQQYLRSKSRQETQQ